MRCRTNHDFGWRNTGDFGKNIFFLALASSLLLFMGPAGAATFDAEAAESLARKSKCFNCHAVSREKVAPSLTSIAQKYRGDQDAANKLHRHLTTNPLIKEYGEEEQHDSLRTSDDHEIDNVVLWILSL